MAGKIGCDSRREIDGKFGILDNATGGVLLVLKIGRCPMEKPEDIIRLIGELSDDDRARLAKSLLDILQIEPARVGKYAPSNFPLVVHTPGVCGGSARLIRTRIPVRALEEMRRMGTSEAKILEGYPTLTASDLVQAWGYVAANKREIDREIAENARY